MEIFFVGLVFLIIFFIVYKSFSGNTKASVHTNTTESLEDRMRAKGYVRKSGKIQCSVCGGNCGQCGDGGEFH